MNWGRIFNRRHLCPTRLTPALRLPRPRYPDSRGNPEEEVAAVVPVWCRVPGIADTTEVT